MTARQYPRGHEIYYDYDKEEWFYSDDNTSAKVDRPCKKCGKSSIDDKDYCLRDLGNQIEFACCGHGNDEYAYILLEDGRRFVLDAESGDVE